VSERPTVSIDGSSLHYRRLGADFDGTPIVFLHEGLGSIELWRDFPLDVVTKAHRPALAYSRHGNGWSTPLASPRKPDYMHTEALSILPEFLDRLIDRPPILVGHSDGASIALIFAGAGNPVNGLVLIAPHVFVEDEGLEAIRSVRRGFADTNMAEKMEKYHVDAETTFYGWADIWLSPDFRSWNIEEFLAGVSCPTMVVQGDRDEYGTMRQLDAIDAGLDTPSQRLLVEDAGHSPHLINPELVTSTVVEFISGLD